MSDNEVNLKDQQWIYEKEHEVPFMANAGSVLLDLIKNIGLTKGMSLTSVQCPAALLKRISLLEMYARLAAPYKFMLQDWSKLSEEERFLNVLKWSLYMQHYYNQTGIQDIKPYNPILGEQFHGKYVHEDSTSVVTCEQLKHHPPISGVCLENRKYGWVYNRTVATDSKFLGNSVESWIMGSNKFSLLFLDEDYLIRPPQAIMRNLLFKTSYFEQSGKMIVDCRKTGIYAQLEFLEGNFAVRGYVFKRGENRTKKALYYLEGNMDSTVYITKDVENHENKTVFTEKSKCQRFPEYKLQVKPVAQQKPNESRRVWHNLTYQLIHNNISEAGNEKHKVEQHQRELRKLRKEGWDWDKDWKQELFEKTGIVTKDNVPLFQKKNILTKEKLQDQSVNVDEDDMD